MQRTDRLRFTVLLDNVIRKLKLTQAKIYSAVGNLAEWAKLKLGEKH